MKDVWLTLIANSLVAPHPLDPQQMLHTERQYVLKGFPGSLSREGPRCRKEANSRLSCARLNLFDKSIRSGQACSRCVRVNCTSVPQDSNTASNHFGKQCRTNGGSDGIIVVGGVATPVNNATSASGSCPGSTTRHTSHVLDASYIITQQWWHAAPIYISITYFCSSAVIQL